MSTSSFGSCTNRCIDRGQGMHGEANDQTRLVSRPPERAAPPTSFYLFRASKGIVSKMLQGLCPRISGIYKASTPVFDSGSKMAAPERTCRSGARAHRRTVGLAIPHRVASPQSPTPLHQAPSFYRATGETSPRRSTASSSHPRVPMTTPRLLFASA